MFEGRRHAVAKINPGSGCTPSRAPATHGCGSSLRIGASKLDALLSSFSARFRIRPPVRCLRLDGLILRRTRMNAASLGNHLRFGGYRLPSGGALKKAVGLLYPVDVAVLVF